MSSQSQRMGSICIAAGCGHAMEVEQYGYHHGQAVDLGPIMPVTQFRVTDEAGTSLCAIRALVFEGSILAYNPARDEVEWISTCGVTNDLSWAEEKSAMALVNYVPHISQEVACIAGLGACHLMSWSDDSSSQEDEEEEDEQEEGDEHEDAEEQGEVGPKSTSSGVALEQGKTEQEVEPCRQRRLWEWGSIMDEEDEEEHLAFDDPQSDSDATAGGLSPAHLTPWGLGSPRETAVEVHAQESEVEEH